MLRLKNLTKTYNLRNVVNHVNLEIPQSCCGLIGPNGAGKTTIILMVLGLIQITEGSASILGKNVNKEIHHSKINIGYLPENVGFYPNWTGFEHLLFYARLRKSTNPRKETKDLLKWCGLKKEYWYRKTKTYSKGMRQRLGLAQAFVEEPNVVFLDEPLSSIDPLGRDDLITKIGQKKREGINIIISSHIIQEVESIIDYLAIIDNGSIALSGNFIDLTLSSGFYEFEIGLKKNSAEDSIQNLYEEISESKVKFLSEPILLDNKIIIKCKRIKELKEILDNFEDSYIKPIDGTLIKIYKKGVKNG